MKDFRGLKIAFRDAKNALLGKSALIQEYRGIVDAIDYAMSQNTREASELKAIKEDWKNLTEFELVTDETRKNTFVVKDFNEYNATRKQLKAKVEFGRKIIEKYKIGPRPSRAAMYAKAKANTR